MSLRSPTIIIIRKTTTSGIISSQKPSYYLSNLYICDYKLRDKYQDCRVDVLYLIFCLVSRKAS